jgi:hypothetical protein
MPFDPSFFLLKREKEKREKEKREKEKRKDQKA